MKYFKFIFASIIFCSCSNYKTSQVISEVNVDEIYKSWDKNSNQNDHESLRYKFLEKFKEQNLHIADFYIIESPISGEFYLPRIWIMSSRNNKSTDVLKFEFINRKWEFKERFLLPYQFQYRRENYLRTNEKEYNWNDVTISYVVQNQVVNSDFFKRGEMKEFVFELPELENHF